jgi:hypothetical protein
MCDVFVKKCHHRGCMAMLPVHLENFATPRNEITVFCGKHLPASAVRVFTLTEGDEAECYDIGWQMGIRAHTERAYNNREGNHPNLSVTWDTEDRK